MPYPRSFFRGNRQYIISLAAIEVVRNHSVGRLEVELKPKARPPVLVSGNRATEFKEWLGK